MAVPAKHPLEIFFLAVRQLVMGMDLKSGTADVAGSTLDPEMMENHAFADTWDVCPMIGVDLCGHRCAESSDLW
jgi:hypothetical protein